MMVKLFRIKPFVEFFYNLVLSDILKITQGIYIDNIDWLLLVVRKHQAGLGGVRRG